MRKAIAFTAASLILAATIPALAESDNAHARGDRAAYAGDEHLSCGSQVGGQQASNKSRRDDGCFNEVHETGQQRDRRGPEKHGIGGYDMDGES
jgi:hypothetical protein